MSEAKIGVVGIGPVGGVLSAYLIDEGMDVTVIDLYEEHVQKVCTEGLVLEGDNPLTVVFPSSCLSIPEACEKGLRFDIVFVCVKATAMRFVAPQVPTILAEDGVAVSFQNGLDTEKGILTALGPERTLRGVVNYAGNLLGPGRIRKTFFHPPNHLGAAVPGTAAAEAKAKEVSQLMSKSVLKTEFSDNVQLHVWEKAIRNAGLMPISALSGQNMAQVMSSERSLHLVENLLKEEIAIAKAIGIDFGESFYEETLEYYRGAGAHIPSMRGDVVDGRQTEIEYLNHKIAEYGENNGVPCPYNRALANLVLCIDEVATENRKDPGLTL
jgi:2-dehydropantoate 2-reductase